jgi:hypothetical protein
MQEKMCADKMAQAGHVIGTTEKLDRMGKLKNGSQ